MREQLRFLHLNTVQLSKLLQENVPSFQKGECVGAADAVRLCLPAVAICAPRLSLRRGMVSLPSETPPPPVGNTHKC